MCPNRLCLAPTPCPNIDADHSDYLALLRKLRQIPGVKKVFVRSGIRYDYMLCDDNDAFFRELVRYHISGQLKVAPEHCIDSVLDYMGKPHIGTYERFMDEYRQLNHKYDKEQYVVPYLMSSHPGSTLADAVALAEYLNRRGRQPEQVQDFYPTPGTISTCMYHTGIDPRTMQPVYVAKTPHEKDMQRALLQWRRPDKRRLVIQALHEAGREDLIGFGKDCLVRPMTDRRKPAKARRTSAAPAQIRQGLRRRQKAHSPPAAAQNGKEPESPPGPAEPESPPPPESPAASPAANPEDPARKAAADELSPRLPHRCQRHRLCRHGHRQGKGARRQVAHRGEHALRPRRARRRARRNARYAHISPQDEAQGISLRLSRAAVPAVRSRGVSYSDLEAGDLI